MKWNNFFFRRFLLKFLNNVRIFYFWSSSYFIDISWLAHDLCHLFTLYIIFSFIASVTKKIPDDNHSSLYTRALTSTIKTRGRGGKSSSPVGSKCCQSKHINMNIWKTINTRKRKNKTKNNIIFYVVGNVEIEYEKTASICDWKVKHI